MPDVLVKTLNGPGRSLSLLHTQRSLRQSPLKERHRAGNQFLASNRRGKRGLLVKAKRSGCDQCHAPQLSIRISQEAFHCRQVVGRLRKVKQIRDRFQRIIDLVGNGTRKPAEGGEFLRLPESELSLLSPLDVLSRAIPLDNAVIGVVARNRPGANPNIRSRDVPDTILNIKRLTG